MKKYRAIIMVPEVVEFESRGDNKQVGNQAWGLCNNFEIVKTIEDTFVPRLLLVVPEAEFDRPEVLLPPPMAA